MPQVGKQALAQFIRTNCLRQLALNLYPDSEKFRVEREALRMPYPQAPRPGLRRIQEAGEEWQAEKLNDLTQTFGAEAIVGDPYQTIANEIRYRPIPLRDALRQAEPLAFVVEGAFELGYSFKDALGTLAEATMEGLQYQTARPDIIAVLEPGTFPKFVGPDGSVHELPPEDPRQQLRVLDIKLTAQPSASYFAEVAYYTMALAGWLDDQAMADRFIVVPDCAVWPGSHDASHLVRVERELVKQGGIPTVGELWEAMQEDLEAVPFEVFALRVRRFFQVDLPKALGTPWRDLEWHVDNRCSFCEYLGEPRGNTGNPTATPHPDHCMPTARETDHLSRIAFVSAGARLSLNLNGVQNVANLAERAHNDQVFDRHQVLRATRTVVAGRATSLQTGEVWIPELSGTSASMPRWADLRVYLSVNFDIGSAITVAFGLEAFWREARPFQSPLIRERRNRHWDASVLIVPRRDLADEQRELLAFLRQIHNILSWCDQEDQRTLNDPLLNGLTQPRRADYRTKVQFYVWDQLQYDHLARVIGRHLHAVVANNRIAHLTWLFPPEEVLPNPDLVTRRSPITTVRNVVRALLAAPVPHFYSLVELANVYDGQNIRVHPLFSTPLSDQIPSERAHEIWSNATDPRHWQEQMAIYVETVRKRLRALRSMTRRLEQDLRPELEQTAPLIRIAPPEYQTRVSVDGQLWYAFARLNQALEELVVHQTRAMPPHEREARFRSARLLSRLTGDEERLALQQMNLTAQQGRRVYRLREDSKDVKAKVGDFSFALAPEDQSGFLDRRVAAVVRDTALEPELQDEYGQRYWRLLMEDLLGVTIVGLDRNQCILVVDANRRSPQILDRLETAGVVRLQNDIVLDPLHKDFFTKKLLTALRAVGNPPVARNNPNPLVRQSTGQTNRGARATGHLPCADFIWNARAMSDTARPGDFAAVRGEVEQHLENQKRKLNQTQWQAWEEALSHRARLVWGPPGTGKSTTVRAIVLGAVLEALQADRPLRVLVSAFTYTALDNILLDLAEDLATLRPGIVDVFRLRSGYRHAPEDSEHLIDLELNRWNPTVDIANLRNRLTRPTNVFVVGSPPQQVHNLLTCHNGAAQAQWFDLIVIDEASQMDVAHSILPMCAVSTEGSVILAGDHLQLPPIHQAEAPKGLEHLVGSVYTFWKDTHEVSENALDTNYRSSKTIVDFARQAGYRETLTSHSPNLAVKMTSPLPTSRPPGWPTQLSWSNEWTELLDPQKSAVCFVYDDGRSSQRNDFEADAVASLLFLLQERVADQLRHEIDPVTNNAIPAGTQPYSPPDFWGKAVGVVTPHRAQQGLIITRLQEIFGATGETADYIRDAVDTVERFQGQQRDVMIASYTLGDPDQIIEEEEFLMSLNRFNVIASRARAKLVVFVSQEVIGHLARDAEVLRESRLLKVYAEIFCSNSRAMDLSHLDNGTEHIVPGTYRWH